MFVYTRALSVLTFMYMESVCVDSLPRALPADIPTTAAIPEAAALAWCSYKILACCSFKNVNRLRFFWTRFWGKTCFWKRS
jgi:hypothetical protein